jgi:hypothetical protein
MVTPAKKTSTTIIGFGYRKGSGKSSAAHFLANNYDFKRQSFAEPLRQLAVSINPLVVQGIAAVNLLNRNRLEDVVDSYGWDSAKNTHPEVRRTLQAVGAGVRKLSPDFWVDLAMASAAKHELVVFDDVRYPNEAAAIKKAGGLVVLIDRPGRGSLDIHESEHALDNYDGWDYVITNNGTVESLLAEVDKVAHRALGTQ